MFTGIVTEIGITKMADGRTLEIISKDSVGYIGKGDSIAVNGVCLTIVNLSDGVFSVDTMPETIRLTNLGSLRIGSPVNLETPLTLSRLIGGHLTQGHIDDTGKLISKENDGDAVLMSFSAAPELMKYVVKKGFIALDGISLTIVDKGQDNFTVSVVKYTLENTNLFSRTVGDKVNLEVDMIAKYVESFLSDKAGSST